ncbi:hypothetical protein [Paraglaciecola sp. 25GB23A]|uniref:hypothetical protein n=1 Tax=Paraglaciecola sp. 25GB23A TaxID=3156068 RepID=UPI0032AEA6E6
MTALKPLFNSTASDTHSDPLQQSLINIWSKIEKQQKRNQTFLDKKEKIFAEFKTKVLPLEHQNTRQAYEFIEFLISFVGRKSFSDYQHEELLEWIANDLEYLRTHPFVGEVNLDALQNKFNEALSEFSQSESADIDPDEIERVRYSLETIFCGKMQLTDDEIVALIKDPSLIDIYIEQMQQNVDEEQQSEDKTDQHKPFEDLFGQQTENEDDQYHAPQDERQRDLDKLFKGGQLNKIYKRLASLLHPDKEQDPVKKAQKHVIMQTLSAARKNKDAFTLIQLYQTHINDGAFLFDTDTLTPMLTLLRAKSHRLDDELHAEKSNSDVSTLVWRKFFERSNKQTEQNFNAHISALKREYREQKSIMQQNQTVAKMKKLLQERVDANCGWVDDSSIDLFDLFR